MNSVANKYYISKPKFKILLIGQLPPPIHGVSVMNQIVINSKLIKDNFEIDVLTLRFAEYISDIGKIRITKILNC